MSAIARVFVLDNYDSFTFNLVQLLGELGASLDVVRNDRTTIDEIASYEPDAVVISPGPGVPSQAGVSVALVRWCADTGTPLLGVCLGHQAIAEAFGARITHAPEVVHGKTSHVHHDGSSVFAGLDDPFDAMRYHSLAVDRESLPDELVVNAWTDDDVIMGLRNTVLPIDGVQFHPESILTATGKQLLSTFLTSAADAVARREAATGRR